MDESKASKLQDFAHRILKFATTARCIQYFEESSSIDYDAVDVHGCTILMTACAYGRDDVIVYLAQRTHYFLSTTIAIHSHILHFAVRSSKFELVQALVETAPEVQALINVPNANGDTVLMMACCLSNLSIVQYLIALGADANVMNAEKVTAMMCTLNQANPNRMRQAMIVRHLLDVGCQSMNWTNTDGNTALHLAILANNDLVVELFSGIVGLDIQVQNYSGYNVSELVYSLPNCDTKILSIVEEMWERLEAVADQKGDALLQLEASSTVSVGKNSSKAARRKKSKDKKLKKQILKKQEEVCLKKEDFSKSLESKENGSPELDVEHVQDEKCIDMDPIDVIIREADDDDDVSQWVTVTRGKDGFKKEEFSNQNNSELSRSELSDPQLPGLVKNGTSSTTWIIHDRIDSTPIPSLPLDSGRIARPAGLLDSSALPINVDETLKEAFRSIDSRTEVLDLSVPHFLGMQVDSLSLAQLECLSRAHMILCRRIDAIKLGRLMSLKQDSLGHLSLVPDSPSPI